MSPTNQSSIIGAVQNQSEPTFLQARTWPSFAMMTHGLIDEVLRVMNEGGLTQPGVAERIQGIRSNPFVAAQN